MGPCSLTDKKWKSAGQWKKQIGAFSGTELLLIEEANPEKLTQNVNRRTESSYHEQMVNTQEI